GVAAEEAGDVVRRAPHEAEGRLRPGLGGQPFCFQDGMSSGDLVGAPHRISGLRRGERHEFAILRRSRKIEQVRKRTRAAREGWMRRDILYLFAIDEDLTAIAQRF